MWLKIVSSWCVKVPLTVTEGKVRSIFGRAYDGFGTYVCMNKHQLQLKADATNLVEFDLLLQAAGADGIKQA